MLLMLDQTTQIQPNFNTIFFVADEFLASDPNTNVGNDKKAF